MTHEARAPEGRAHTTMTEKAPPPSRGLDVLQARVAFRDRAFIDVMDLALRFLVVHGRVYARVALVVLAPCIAVTLAAAATWDWLVAWSIALGLSFAAQVPFTVLASRLVFQEKITALAVVRAAATELPRVLAMRVVWTMAVGAAALALVAPAAWVGSVLLFVDEVMILERSPIGPAFGRSHRVAVSSMGNALMGLLMVVTVPLLGVLLADIGGRAFISDLLQFRGPPPLWSEGGSVLAILGWFGVLPYVATARFFTYLNARTRAEGWDIQTRFAAIAARAEQEGAA